MEILEIIVAIIALTMVVWTTISIVLLVKIWPMYKWSMNMFKRLEPTLEHGIEEYEKLLNEETR